MDKELSECLAADVAIVGAGPAGMMAAIAAAEALGGDAANKAAEPGPRRVVVVEQLARPGAKLLATGGGRCNLTNTLEAKEFLHRFGRRGPFVRPAITELDSEALREFFRRLGVETVVEEGGAVYPSTHSAASVQKALMDRCRRLGVQFLLGAAAKELLLEGGAVRGLVVGGATARSAGPAPGGGGGRCGGAEGGKLIETGRVILAAGGRSYPELGGTGGGYDLARGAGHQIVPPTPALVDLRTKETWPAHCAGISVSGARVSLEQNRGAKRQALTTTDSAIHTATDTAVHSTTHTARFAREGVTGDVLFTHEGLSGPAVLDLSGDVAELLSQQPASAGPGPVGVAIRLELLPGTSPAGSGSTGAQEWRGRLDGWRESHGRQSVGALLGGHMPARLAQAVCGLAAVAAEVKAAHLGVSQRRALAAVLAGVRLTVIGTGGFQKAMVTRGGVSLKEIESRTMESKLARGLFFAGEVLDVDGPCGGFNLQWAFSSGHLAGISAVRQA